jgi:hypothetical protein
VSELVETGEMFIRHLDKLETKNPGKFYDVPTLVGAVIAANIELPEDVSFPHFLEQLQHWDWIESNGDGFNTENQSFRVTAKGQYRAAASIDYAAHYKQVVGALQDMPMEYKSEAGTFGSGAYGDGSYGSKPTHDETGVYISSHNWTGLPKVGVLGEAAVTTLKGALSTVDDAVLRSNATNQEKAQARAYVMAIHALADAPEPPADLIWEMVSRADQLSGIASLFVSLVALYVAVSS